MIATNYSYGIERDEEALERNDLDHTKWTNPLESRHVTHSVVLMHGSLNCITLRLPIAPSLQIYCVYGHGKETEVSIWSG